MKKVLLSLFLLSTTFVGKGQNPPPQPTVLYAIPCAYVGASDLITLSPSPGALGYTWISNSGGYLLDGMPLPYTTTSNTVTISIIGIVPVYEICVFAFNNWGNSDTSCIYKNSIPNIAFHPNNDSIVTPNSSGIYSFLNYHCLISAVWIITGDADINGINDTLMISLPNNYHTATINFGPAFTTGTLCVYGITHDSLITDTICMTINAVTGIEEHNQQNEITIYPNPAGEELKVQCSKFKTGDEIKIYDVMGKEVLQSTINLQPSTFNIKSLQTGIYFIEINGVRKKFVKQ